MPSQDWFQRTLRSQGAVRARPGKRRITHEKDYEQRRFAQAKEWIKYPKRWWQKGVHVYIDNKKFVKAGTAQHKKLLRCQKVQHHLRTPAEGNMKCFVLPKKTRMLSGVPSVDITCAVAHDRIIFWHENEGRWNGEKAKLMYQKLGAALRKHYGMLRTFHVVEDGDTKGFRGGPVRRAVQPRPRAAFPSRPAWQRRNWTA